MYRITLFYSGFMEDGTYPAQDFHTYPIQHSASWGMKVPHLENMCLLSFSPHRITNIIPSLTKALLVCKNGKKNI